LQAIGEKAQEGLADDEKAQLKRLEDGEFDMVLSVTHNP
jgi:hypothetical protein